MHDAATTPTPQSPEQLPLPLTIPTQVSEDGSSVAVGYTESDPLGPQPDDEQALIAGKFKSVADLEKAYKELESKMGQPREQENSPKETVPDSEKIASVETTEEATALLKEKGLDISAFTQEFERTGQLSQESYAKLNTAGITPEMVNAYIDGQRVLVESQVAEVKNSIGGEAEYAKLIDWASINLNTAEKEAYQRILDSNDLTAIKFAAAGLQARYRDTMGKDPKVVVAGSAPSGNDGKERFASRAEMVAAMQDPRYSKDPAYRARVERKVINSNL